MAATSDSCDLGVQEAPQSVTPKQPPGQGRPTTIAAQTSTQTEHSTKPYTNFTKRHKRLLTAIIGMTSLVSPLTANIYLPLLPLLQAQYQASAQAINLTLTLYVIVAAIMPAFIAPVADTHGRRVVATITGVVYAAGSLGLTLNDVLGKSYTVLLLMRAVQALGASASASITYGVISDVCIPAERGTMVGPAISASNLGIVLGPTLGGLIAWKSTGVEYVFLALTVFGALNVIVVLLLLPETARMVVGNGGEGKRVRIGGFRGWVLLGPRWCSSPSLDAHADLGQEANKDKVASVALEPRQCSSPETESSSSNKAGCPERGKQAGIKIPNPLSCLKIMLSKHTSILLWLAGCNYAVWYCVMASWPQIYARAYNWSTLAIGLAYLPSATAIVVAGLVAGPWMNARYRHTACEAGLPPDGHRVAGFPIERARIRGQWPVFAGTHLGIVVLGWAIHREARPAVLLVVQAVVGFMQSLLFFAFNTLLVDVHPDQPSTASAAASLVRSGLSGVGVAVLQPLVDVMGWGWYFTLLAILVGGLQGLGILVLLKRGEEWRGARRRA